MRPVEENFNPLLSYKKRLFSTFSGFEKFVYVRNDWQLVKGGHWSAIIISVNRKNFSYLIEFVGKMFDSKLSFYFYFFFVENNGSFLYIF